MIRAGDLKTWLSKFGDDTLVGIDDSGLTLVAINSPATLDIGDIPEGLE